ncbi:hypothetical protein K491DRAFT_135384 [Lophiostoma macrostomum CBS 122681]|uniref:Lytic polysaccharide monooxygenase n=1 Tax=Lophiostoma macrostomum CBS 122681 TaxID=1314788 RepID=A0A6A6TID5_9PLEO|nr:hypothetical protein K491DRAFT_135384 [Lophiostoma macrostomum CBS 122681]
MAFRSLPVGLLALMLQICGSQGLAFRDACSNNCSVAADAPVSYTWAPYSIKETITAATLVVVVNTIYNTTSTSLKLANLPSGYTTPNVNAEGTHIETISYTRSGKLQTTVIAFPTEFVALADGYSWNGTLATSIPGHNANGSCVTQIGSMMSLPFPSYPQPPVTTTATHPDLGPDPEGIYWKPTTEPGVPSDYSKYYTDIGAWQTCSFLQAPLPMEVPFTAKFMTATMTQYDGSKSSEAPQPASTPDSPAASATPDPEPQHTDQPEPEHTDNGGDQPSKTDDAPQVTNQPASQGPVFVTISDSHDNDPEPSNSQNNGAPAETVVTHDGSAVTVAPGQTFVMTQGGSAVTVAPDTKTQNDAPAETVVTHDGSAVTVAPGETFVMTQDGTAP